MLRRAFLKLGAVLHVPWQAAAAGTGTIVAGVSVTVALLLVNVLTIGIHGILPSIGISGPPAVSVTDPGTTSNGITNPAPTDSTATLQGTVNPDGYGTTYQWKWGTTTSYGSSTTAVSVGAGTSDIDESHDLTGLAADTEYYYELTATNTDGTSNATGNFTTPSSASGGCTQQATTEAATLVGSESAQLNGVVNPEGNAATYHFAYGPAGDVSNHTATESAGSGSSNEDVSATITGLATSTAYYFVLVVSEASCGGNVDGATLSFTTASTQGSGTPGPPYTTTDSASTITTTTATLNAVVNPDDYATDYYFNWGSTSDSSCPPSMGNSTTDTAIGNGSTSLNEDAPISGLTPGATYYYAVVATNAIGTSCGAVKSFHATPPAAPSATTTSATPYLEAAAFTGTVTASGYDTDYYFEYGPSASNMPHDTATTAGPTGTSSASESATVYSLSPDTTYYYQLVAYDTIDSSVVAYGGIESVTTLTPSPPTATTTAATSVTGSSATLNGSITESQAVSTTYQFMWGTSSGSLTNSTPSAAGPSSGSATESYNLTGLSGYTTYYYEIVVSDSYNNPVTGGVKSFETTGTPTVATEPATDVTATSATLNGQLNPEGVSASCTFFWNTTKSTSGAHSTACSTSPSSSMSAISESADVTGLNAGKNYWFLIQAQYGSSTVNGSWVLVQPGGSGGFPQAVWGSVGASPPTSRAPVRGSGCREGPRTPCTVGPLQGSGASAPYLPAWGGIPARLEERSAEYGDGRRSRSLG